NHGLQCLSGALRIEQFQCQRMLAEESLLLAKLGRRILPVAALPDRELQRVLGRRARGTGNVRESNEPTKRCCKPHASLIRQISGGHYHSARPLPAGALQRSYST